MDMLEDIGIFLSLKYTFRSPIYLVHHILGKLKDTYNLSSLGNMFCFMFLVDKKFFITFRF